MMADLLFLCVCVCVCVYLYIKTVALLETWFRTLAYSSMKLSNTPIIKYTPIVYIYIYILSYCYIKLKQ